MFDEFDRILQPDAGALAQALNGIFKIVGFFLRRPKLLGLIFVAYVLIGAALDSQDFILLPLGLVLIWAGVLLRRRGL